MCVDFVVAVVAIGVVVTVFYLGDYYQGVTECRHELVVIQQWASPRTP